MYVVVLQLIEVVQCETNLFSMSTRNLRTARSFRSRAKARGIRNVPPTPSLSQGHGGTFDFDENDAGGDLGENEEAALLWVKCRASGADGGGFHYKPGTLLGKGRRPNTFSFQIKGADKIEVGRDSIGPPVEADFSPKANMVDIVNVHEVSLFVITALPDALLALVLL